MPVKKFEQEDENNLIGDLTSLISLDDAIKFINNITINSLINNKWKFFCYYKFIKYSI
jgi:hypothetical protein